MNKARGALSIEYAVLIAIVVLAIIAMSDYFRRAVCGKFRSVGDNFSYGRQWEVK